MWASEIGRVVYSNIRIHIWISAKECFFVCMGESAQAAWTVQILKMQIEERCVASAHTSKIRAYRHKVDAFNIQAYRDFIFIGPHDNINWVRRALPIFLFRLKEAEEIKNKHQQQPSPSIDWGGNLSTFPFILNVHGEKASGRIDLLYSIKLASAKQPILKAREPKHRRYCPIQPRYTYSTQTMAIHGTYIE